MATILYKKQFLIKNYIIVPAKLWLASTLDPTKLDLAEHKNIARLNILD